MSQNALAKKLGVTKGRVSQIINNPGNLTLRMIVRCARATKMKVSVVAYDDGDPKNYEGAVHSLVFEHCWNYTGKPKDNWDLKEKGIISTDDA